ncbi:hypothetical protein HUJ04_013464 [Dendroctonus ponderosae]
MEPAEIVALAIGRPQWGSDESLTKGDLLRLSGVRLYQIWNYLPEELKNDEELQTHLPCLEHYNRDEDQVHIDGPPQAKFRCRVCRQLRQRSNAQT